MSLALRDRLERVAAARKIISDIQQRRDAEGAAGEVEGSRPSGEAAWPPWSSTTRGTERPGERPRPRGARPEATSPAAPVAIYEQRIPIAQLGLEIIGRRAPEPLTLAQLGLRGEAPRRWEDILFLDTETTGLSSGAGTYVFLLGTARIEAGELVLRQHLLQDLGGERRFVQAITDEMSAFRACASYNGKSFDLPILRTRVVLALRAELSVDESHLDLLHPARRLWKDRFGSTTLRQLEASVLDDPRVDDIPGALIPERYFGYLRTRDERVLEPVLRHNAKDVISLVRIADRVASAVIAARSGRAPDHPPAALALGRIFDREGEHEAAFCCYESAYVEGDATVRVRSALLFARALERRGSADRAITMLETLLSLGAGSPAWREQAEARLRRLLRKRWRTLARAS